MRDSPFADGSIYVEVSPFAAVQTLVRQICPDDSVRGQIAAYATNERYGQQQRIGSVWRARGAMKRQTTGPDKLSVPSPEANIRCHAQHWLSTDGRAMHVSPCTHKSSTNGLLYRVCV